MKNVLCLLVGLGCLGAHYYPSRPVLTVPAPVPAVTAEAAAMAAPVPRMYYHSPLDAPAMRAEAYTGMGYFSPIRGGFDLADALAQTHHGLSATPASDSASPTTGAVTTLGNSGLTRSPAELTSAPQNPLDQAAAATHANMAAISEKSLGALAAD